MPIQAKCPNAACGKVLTVPDALTGRKLKCPACGEEMPILGSPPAAVPATEARKRVGAAQASAEETEPSAPVKGEAPAEKQPKKVESNLASILLFGGAIALILLAAFGPLFTWIAVTVKEGEAKNVGKVAVSGLGTVEQRAEAKGDTKTASLPSESRPEGRLILTLCILAALVLGGGFAVALSGRLNRKVSEQVLNVTLLTGLGWSIVLIVWSLGWFWKMVTLTHRLQDGMAEIQLEGRTGSGATHFALQPFPGLGLFLLVLAALFAAYLFSQTASRLNKLRDEMFRAEKLKGVSKQMVEKLYMGRKQLIVAEAAGLLLGGLILLAVVQPWNANDLWKGIEPSVVDLLRTVIGLRG